MDQNKRATCGTAAQTSEINLVVYVARGNPHVVGTTSIRESGSDSGKVTPQADGTSGTTLKLQI